MKKMTKIIFSAFSIATLFACTLLGGMTNAIAKAAEDVDKTETPITNKTLEGRYYYVPHDKNYNYTWEHEIKDGQGVAYTSGGYRSVGSFYLRGQISGEQKETRIDPNNNEKNDYFTIGADSNITFCYNYNLAYHDDSKPQRWALQSDTCTQFQNYPLGAELGKGGLLIEKSYDGENYVKAVNPQVRFLDAMKSRRDFYTTSGEDIGRGCYYRVRIFYEMYTWEWNFAYMGWHSTDFKEYVECYEFYIAKNTGIITLHNIDVDIPLPEPEKKSAKDLDSMSKYEVTNEEINHNTEQNPEPEKDRTEEVEKQNAELEENNMLRKGETLVDGSSTTTGFRVDKLGSLSYEVKVSKNGGEPIIAEDQQEFTEDGIYKVTVTTKLGVTNTKTITVFTGGDTKGYSTYFGEYILDGGRLFSYEDLPTYEKGSKVHINSVAKEVPGLVGTIKRYHIDEKNKVVDDEVINVDTKRAAYDLVLAPGRYQVVLYAGDKSAIGSIYEYKFNFIIVEDQSGPRVNYSILTNSHQLYDLESKHYEVALPTTKGGYVFVCFSMDSFQDAWDFAYKSEVRFIEERDDGAFYYKDPDNPETKIAYWDKSALTEAVNYFADNNVEVAYFNPTDKFTYDTNDEKNGILKDITDINSPDSMHIFPSAAEREKMCKRQRFLNHYTFIKVGDFDTTSISALCEKDGKIYNINYDEPVAKQLHVSSKYTITETNKYGESITYDTYFMKENTAVSTWEVITDGVSKEITIDNSDMKQGKYEITCDTLAIKSITNALDDDMIITVKAPLVYSYELKCLTEEFGNIDIYKKGHYEITIIDRLGNKFLIDANISGKTRLNKVNDRNRDNLSAFYNRIHRRDVNVDKEDPLIDDSSLLASIKTEVDFNVYLPSSVKNYKNRLQEAIDAYNNPDATQADLTLAKDNLDYARTKLIPDIDRSELDVELKLFEEADEKLYVTNTYKKWLESYNKGLEGYSKDELDPVELYELVLAMRQGHDGLVLRGDKAELIELLDSIHAIDCSKYTPKTVEPLNDSYLEGMKVYDNIDALQEDIDQIYKLIELRKSSLKERANFDKLDALITKVTKVNPKNYTKESITKLKEDFDKAIKVFNDKNIDQTSIDDVYFKLYDSFVEIVPIGDKHRLIDLMVKISKLDYYMYTNESINAVKKIYDECFGVLDLEITQEEVDAKYQQLNESYVNMQRSHSKEILLAGLENNKVENIGLYNIKTSNKYIDKVNEINKKLYGDQDITEEEAKTLVSELEEAKGALSMVNIDVTMVSIIGGSSAAGIALISVGSFFIARHIKRKRKI